MPNVHPLPILSGSFRGGGSGGITVSNRSFNLPSQDITYRSPQLLKTEGRVGRILRRGFIKTTLNENPSVRFNFLFNPKEISYSYQHNENILTDVPPEGDAEIIGLVNGASVNFTLLLDRRLEVQNPQGTMWSAVEMGAPPSQFGVMHDLAVFEQLIGSPPDVEDEAEGGAGGGAGGTSWGGNRTGWSASTTIAPTVPPMTLPEGNVSPGAKTAGNFTDICLAQRGDAYRLSAEASPDDPDPDVFDCSELVEWACSRIGVRVPDGAYNQWKHCTGIMVSQAATTRGALLFAGDGTGTGRDAITHVAVSLGNGTGTIEAMGTRYGVREGTIGNRFRFAGLIPGLPYGGSLGAAAAAAASGTGGAGGTSGRPAYRSLDPNDPSGYAAGYLGPKIFDIVFGPALRFHGRLTGVSLALTHFSNRMIPTMAAMDISAQQTYSPGTSNNTPTLSGVGSPLGFTGFEALPVGAPRPTAGGMPVGITGFRT